MRATIWKWLALAYYLFFLALWPEVSCQFPFDKDDLWHFGIIPTTAGVFGILTSHFHKERPLAWFVFLLGVVGIALSFVPWRQAMARFPFL